jgi:phosphopentomutase
VARTIVLIVLDSVGIGGAPDAADFGDEGSATLQHVASAVGGISLPNLGALGLGTLADIEGVPPWHGEGAAGVMVEKSPGKDTTTGHWEIAGVILDKPFPTYPDGFPPEVIAAFEAAIGRTVLGNLPASGTEIIESLGPSHLGSGEPIVYTSADSVLQVAAHVDVVPLEQLYDWCRTARDLLVGEHEVGRVIARPFAGRPGSFTRTPDRHDFAVPPPPTVLDALVEAGKEVVGVGKISDIFAGRGVTRSRPTTGNEEGVDIVLDELAAHPDGLIFANLIDFDQSFGHRNDPKGYARALEAFDARLPELRSALLPADVLIVTADHGNDPTTPSTDHSRERVPLLVTGPAVPGETDLGERATFADCAATIADLLEVGYRGPGASFASQIR